MGYCHCISFDGEARSTVRLCLCRAQRTRRRCLGMGKRRETAASLLTLTERDRNRESKMEGERTEERECFEALEVFPCNVTSYCLHSAEIPLPQVMW